MPVSMIHLSVAKKINPDASIAYFVGNLAPDATQDGDIKQKAHLYHLPDREEVLRKFALNANNDYLKGFVLHLFADTKFHSFWNENTLMPYQKGKEFWAKYMEENRRINSYVYHNTEWANNLFEEMENWDYSSYVETEFIVKDDIKRFISLDHEQL